MRKLLYSVLLVWPLFVASPTQAQTPSAGNCFYVDYQQWCDLGYPGIFINCGNDASFNTGSQLTLEVWARAYIFGENRKIMGKMSNTLNNGYVMGFENLNLYSEIFNPDVQVVPHAGTGPIPADSAWVHLVTTYNSTGQMVSYLNGVNIGETSVFPQAAITANSEPFIIGLAPWDQYSFEFAGGLDEVRVWNVARTEAEIKDNMFRTLSGNEPGLIAYYNFNNDVDSVVHDLAPNTLNGILKNSESTCFSWAPSEAPVGDSILSTRADINASWYGKNPAQYTYAITTNGLSLITSIGSKQFWNCVVFGHNNKTGKTNTNAPVGAPVDFERLSREWYVNQTGTFTSQVVFNVQDAADGGSMLISGGADSLYTLLMRTDTTADFEAVCSASTVMGNTVLFNGVLLTNAYYSLGYSSEKLAGTASVNHHTVETLVEVYPNPAQDQLFFELASPADVALMNLSGQLVFQGQFVAGQHHLTIADYPRGVYFMRILSADQAETQTIILQ